MEAAIGTGAPIIPVFIWAPEEAGDWAPGAASKWFLHKALASLTEEWRVRSGKLILRKGDTLAELRDVIEKTGAARVFWNRRYESPLRELDADIKRALREDGIDVQSFNSALLNEPHTVSTSTGKPYKVYTNIEKAASGRWRPWKNSNRRGCTCGARVYAIASESTSLTNPRRSSQVKPLHLI